MIGIQTFIFLSSICSALFCHLLVASDESSPTLNSARRLNTCQGDWTGEVTAVSWSHAHRLGKEGPAHHAGRTWEPREPEGQWETGLVGTKG